MASAAPRTRPLRSAFGLAGAAAAAGVPLLLAGGISLPDFNALLDDASRSLGAWAYPAVAGFAFAETAAFVGLAIPGETAIVVGGVVAARGEAELVPLVGLVWGAALAGDVASFSLGRRLGRPFIERHGERLHLGPERLDRVERFYERHGGKAVLFGRFTGLVRAVSPFLAGASGLGLRRFLPWSAAGALLWAAAFTLVGYTFSESFAEAGGTAARVALVLAAAAALAYAAITFLRSRSARRRERAQAQQLQSDERAERPHTGAEHRSGEHVEREVHAQVDPRDTDRGGDAERRTGAGAGRGWPRRWRRRRRSRCARRGTTGCRGSR